jgi:glucose-1-phosphate thymidylyltransferase
MTEDIIGLIPAAGKGSRLKLPYPKELYPIIRQNRYKPVSQYVVESLTASGVSHIVFVINETKHQLIGYFGDGNRFGCNISYVVQEQREDENQSASPGLAHALNSAYHIAKGKTICFGMADTIMTPKDIFRQVLNSSHPPDDVLLGLFIPENPQKFGMVRFKADGEVIEINDKPAKTDLVYCWGFIVWRPKFTEYLNQSILNGQADFAKIMNQAILDGLHFRAVPVENGTYSDLGTYEEILELEKNQSAMRIYDE